MSCGKVDRSKAGIDGAVGVREKAVESGGVIVTENLEVRVASD